MKEQHPSILHTIRTLKGNERACLWTEPLWGIPYSLFHTVCFGVHGEPWHDADDHWRDRNHHAGIAGGLVAAGRGADG